MWKIIKSFIVLLFLLVSDVYSYEYTFDRGGLPPNYVDRTSRPLAMRAMTHALEDTVDDGFRGYTIAGYIIQANKRPDPPVIYIIAIPGSDTKSLQIAIDEFDGFRFYKHMYDLKVYICVEEEHTCPASGYFIKK